MVGEFGVWAIRLGNRMMGKFGLWELRVGNLMVGEFGVKGPYGRGPWGMGA